MKEWTQIHELNRQFNRIDGCSDCRGIIKIYSVAYDDGSQHEVWEHSCPWDEPTYPEKGIDHE